MEENFWNIGENSGNDIRNPKLTQVPQRLMFDLYGGCNLRCWHCPRAAAHLGGQDSCRELVDYVLYEVIPHVRYLRIGGNEFGENLLSKHFNYFLSNLDKTHLKEVRMVTNLTHLDEDKAKLIAEKLDIIDVSLEGTGESYTKIRGYAWEKFLKNFELLVKAKRSNSKSNLKIYLNTCAFLGNLEILLGLFDLKGLDISQINFLELHPRDNTVIHECLWKDPSKTNVYIKKFEQRSRETGIAVWMEFKDKYSIGNRIKRALKLQPLRVCHYPWDCISITSEGNVSVCCMLFRIDKVKQYDRQILDILNSAPFQEFRAKVNSPTPNTECLTCQFKNPVSHEQVFLELLMKRLDQQKER